MENNKLERVIFILLRVFGVLSIIGGFLGEERFFSGGGLLVLKNKTIIGNVYMMSPIALVAMIVSIIVYLLLIRIAAKHIRITKKSV